MPGEAKKPLTELDHIRIEARRLKMAADIAYILLFVAVATAVLSAVTASVFMTVGRLVDVSWAAEGLGLAHPDRPLPLLTAQLWLQALALGLWLYAMVRIRTLLSCWQEGRLFTDVEIGALSQIGNVTMFSALLPYVDYAAQRVQPKLAIAVLMLGFLLRLLARVWREGRGLREEVEATI
ncbi:MAG: hypothetical protein KC912_10205 [Proteobacteria bacterium]|nr:hypothetical protein [Pseudomonadota bacterium]